MLSLGCVKCKELTDRCYHCNRLIKEFDYIYTHIVSYCTSLSHYLDIKPIQRQKSANSTFDKNISENGDKATGEDLKQSKNEVITIGERIRKVIGIALGEGA